MLLLDQLQHIIQLLIIDITRVEAGEIGIRGKVHDGVKFRQVPLVAQLTGAADDSALRDVLESVLGSGGTDQFQRLGELLIRL